MQNSEPVAKRGDRVVGVDTHVILVPSPGGPIPRPTPMPFDGEIVERPGATVFVENEDLALEAGTAQNRPGHVPIGGTFQTPPSNMATLSSGSASVFAENRAVARSKDPARCCNDVPDDETGHVLANSTVFAG
ncbi:MAG: PAAR domain-containing protein [Polyangiaceae bacterium]